MGSSEKCSETEFDTTSIEVNFCNTNDDTIGCETNSCETNSLRSEKSYSEPILPTEGAFVEEKSKIPRNRSMIEVSNTKPIAVKSKRGHSLSFSCDEGIVGSA